MIDQAFILAAGFGTRMRPLTRRIPKPLVEVDGQSLLTRTLDHLETAGIRACTINTHYLADKIENVAQSRSAPKITLSHETEILDTGGGIKNALENFEGRPFFVLSGDGLWENLPGQNTLQTMQKAWDPAKMDILILLQPAASMTLTKGVGDYDLKENGQAVRTHDKSGPYMFTSMRINHPRIFDTAPSGPFSYLRLLDEAEKNGRLYGLIHQGDWHHISTPEDLERVNAAYQKSAP